MNASGAVPLRMQIAACSSRCFGQVGGRQGRLLRERFSCLYQAVCLDGAQRFDWLVAKPGVVLAGRQRGAPPAKPPARQLALLCPTKREVVKPGCLFQQLGAS